MSEIFENIRSLPISLFSCLSGEHCFLKHVIELQVHTDENEFKNSFPGILK